MSERVPWSVEMGMQATDLVDREQYRFVGLWPRPPARVARGGIGFWRGRSRARRAGTVRAGGQGPCWCDPGAERPGATRVGAEPRSINDPAALASTGVVRTLVSLFEPMRAAESR